MSSTQEDFVPTHDEQVIASQILNHAGGDASRSLSAEVAVDIFEKSGLSTEVLSEIWNIADNDSSGGLSEMELAIAVRLMGWAQAGRPVSRTLLYDAAGPLPVITGITSDLSFPASYDLFSISTHDRRTFHRLFLESSPVDGLLDGDSVRDIFMKSNLSFDVLAEIWNLVDTHQRGSLDVAQFSVGMHIIHALKACQITSVPTSIPIHVYEQLSEQISLESPYPLLVEPESGSRGTSPSAPENAIPAPTSVEPVADLSSLSKSTELWDEKSAVERRAYDKLFDTLDTQQQGFIDGAIVARYIIKEYTLTAADAAHIWDLADIDNNNRITRSGFAVAMRLVHQRLAGDDIPFFLPPSLVPPLNTSSQPRLAGDDILSTLPPALVPPLNASSQSPSIVVTERPSPLPPGRMRASSQRAPPAVPIGGTSRRHTVTSSSIPSSARPSPNNAHSPFESADDIHDQGESAIPIQTPNFEPELTDEIQNENKFLRKQVEELKKQSQSEYRNRNVILVQENEMLKARIDDMEQSMSQVLSANNGQDLADNLKKEIERLSAKIFHLERDHIELEQSSRALAELSQDNENLNARLRAAEGAHATATVEAENLLETIASLRDENKFLAIRVSDMEKSMAEPETSTSRKELRLLMSDVTRENDSLKARVRDLEEQSMAQLLLSSKNHDDLVQENRRLALHSQEMETIVRQLQSSDESIELERMMETMSQENDDLKLRIREKDRKISDLRSAANARIRDLDQKIHALSMENNLLKTQVASSSRRDSRDDPSVPPPAYDDHFPAAS